MSKIEDPQALIHWLETRAALYSLLAASFLEKPETKFETFGLDTLRRKLSEAIQSFDPETGRLLQFLERSLQNTKLQSLAAEDFQRLLQPDGAAYLRPYESNYLSLNSFRRSRQVGKRAELEVKFFYRHAGLEMDIMFREKADHAGVELAFLKELVLKEIQARQTDHASFAQCYSQWQRQFLEDHVRKWFGEMSRELELKAATDFYRILAKLAWYFVQMDYKLLSKEKPI